MDKFTSIFKPYNKVLADILRITHREIIRIAPKVIVHVYKGSSYFWGFKEQAPDFSNEKNPWMGYRFEKKHTNNLDVYQIIGYIKNEASILTDEERKPLVGTYIIFLSQKGYPSLEKAKLQAQRISSFLQENNITL